ncbi:hypothetical protein ACVWZ9_004000 [Pseudomonas chlororaphis]
MPSEKLFGRYDDLVRLLLGFALTGFLGTYLAQSYTTRQANLNAASKIFADQSEMMGNRYFAMNQITNAIEDNRTTPGTVSSDEIKVRWKEYRSVLLKWNSSRGYNREMIKLYFGVELWNEEREIHYLFRSWGQALEMESRQERSIDLVCLDKEVDRLMSKIHSLQSKMAASIQAGEVGRARKQSKMPTDKAPSAVCLTSIKNL